MEDQADVVDVDAAGGDVGGDQDVDGPSRELGQGAGALVLGLAAVQAAGPDADLASCLLSRSAPCLVRTKMIVRPSRSAISAVTGELVVAVDVQHVVLHRGDRGRRRVDGVGDRVGEEAADEDVDVAVEGGREQQPLAVGRGLVEQLA